MCLRFSHLLPFTKYQLFLSRLLHLTLQQSDRGHCDEGRVKEYMQELTKVMAMPLGSIDDGCIST